MSDLTGISNKQVQRNLANEIVSRMWRSDPEVLSALERIETLLETIIELLVRERHE